MRIANIVIWVLIAGACAGIVYLLWQVPAVQALITGKKQKDSTLTVDPADDDALADHGIFKTAGPVVAYYYINDQGKRIYGTPEELLTQLYFMGR